jgi:hypothetical protein
VKLSTSISTIAAATRAGTTRGRNAAMRAWPRRDSSAASRQAATCSKRAPSIHGSAAANRPRIRSDTGQVVRKEGFVARNSHSRNAKAKANSTVFAAESR